MVRLNLVRSRVDHIAAPAESGLPVWQPDHMGTWNGTELDELTLWGPRLTLRRWLPEDAPQVLQAASTDPWMREFLPIPAPYTAADADAFVNDLGHEGRFEGTGFGSALVETSTGRLVGGAGLRLPGPRHGRRDIGYSVYPWARGNGYAEEASRVLADWAFAHGLVRVELQVSVRNLASIRTALNAGFHYEGVQRREIDIRGEHQDAALFARLANDDGEAIAPVFAPLPGGELNDGVIALRVARREDGPAVFDESNDPLTRSWEFDDRPVDPGKITDRVAMSGLQWLVGPVARMTMVDVATGRYAGAIQLRQVGPPNIAGIGYGVHPDFRGRGYTSRGLRLLIPWAFGPGGFERLELGAKVANIGSQTSAIRAGFAPDGIRRSRLRNPDGTFSDEARFALTRSGG
jgi:RimJ/RimL family protein N-acetyltransferase